jgi:hypothetical protein
MIGFEIFGSSILPMPAFPLSMKAPASAGTSADGGEIVLHDQQWPCSNHGLRPATFSPGLRGFLGIICEVAAATADWTIILVHAGRSLLPILTGLISALLVAVATRLLATFSACFRSAFRVIGKIAGRHLPALFAGLRGAVLIVCKVAAGLLTAAAGGVALLVFIHRSEAAIGISLVVVWHVISPF